MSPGTFMFTLDTEAQWGFPEKASDHECSQHVGAEFRRVVRALLDLMDEYSIPATWAVVGHLFLKECTGHDEGELQLIKPSHGWFPDWYRNDPATNMHTDPGWYSPDVIDAIQSAATRHEIASHSFSHCIFGDTGCGHDVAISELSACQRLAEERGIDLRSFVFPRNSVGHLDVVKQYGYTCYRGKSARSSSSDALRLVRKLRGVAMEFVPIAPPMSECSVTEGLVNIPASMLIRSRSGWRRIIPVQFTQARAQKGIARAVETGAIFHLWTHPLNFACRSDAMFELVRQIFATVDQKRSQGLIRTCTMAEVAEDFIARQT
jgi:hypothetical protein